MIVEFVRERETVWNELIHKTNKAYFLPEKVMTASIFVLAFAHE